MSEKTKKLYRSREERILAGVAGGLGEYFDVDPVLVRIAFILLALINGLGILLYLVMLVVVPREKGKEVDIDRKEKIKEFASEVKEEAQNFAEKAKKNNRWLGNRRDVIAFIIIAVGVISLLSQFMPMRLMHWVSWDLVLSSVIILVGLFILLKK